MVKCSPAAKIRLHCDRHPTRMIRGEDMTEAKFDIQSNGAIDYQYLRVTVIDNEDRYAWTNPIFL